MFFLVNKAPSGPAAAVAGATVGVEIAADFFFNLFLLKLHLRDVSLKFRLLQLQLLVTSTGDRTPS